MAALNTTDGLSEGTFTDNVCFCRICRSLVVCYLAVLAIPFGLLIGLLAVLLLGFFD